MSIKKLFDARQNKKTGKLLTKTTAKAVGDEIESFEQVKSALKERNEFVPGLDYSDPANFVKFGSAERYYVDAMKYVIDFYPYDGTSKEKIDFRLSLNPLEKYIFDKKHPSSTGYVTLGSQNGTPVQYLTTEYYKQEDSVDSFIHIQGGPNASITTRPDGDPDYRDATANVFYDGSDYSRRANNLEFGGPNGATIEFFLKKDGIAATTREVIYDAYNGLASNVAGYGRFTIEMDADDFYITYRHTTDGVVFTGFERQELPAAAAVLSPLVTDNNWHHYAFVISESGADTLITLYRNGVLTLTETIATQQIPLVTGALEARIGAFVTTTQVGGDTVPAGYGVLVASIDEFRVWKDARTSEEIGRNWFTNLNGGTNTKTSNVGEAIADVNLGVYYKFNEGITGDDSLDALVMDYSGRISNGVWSGYVSGDRSTGSAIVDSGASTREAGDPIVRSSHPSYISAKDELESQGRHYDYSNNSSLYHSMPSWIIEEDETNDGDLQKLTQIMSSYFDTLYAQITTLSRVKDTTYTTGDNKPFPHTERLLQSMGFETPEIFSNANLISQFLQKDDKRLIEEKLHNIKNEIYKNIYNNLNYVYKSKGTSKAFRNLIRCYGVGDEIFKINAYVDNQSYKLEDTYAPTTSKSKYIDMSGMSRSDDRNAFVTQYFQGVAGDTHGLIIGDSTLDSFEFTLVGDLFFPEFPSPGDVNYVSYSNETSSMFGFHTPLDTATNSTTLTWAAAESDFGLQVVTERKLSEHPEISEPLASSRDARFVVKNRAGEVLLTTDILKNIYKNKRWVVSLSLRPARYPFAESLTGTAGQEYTLTLVGVNSLLGEEQDSFEVTLTSAAGTSFTIADAENILRSYKRIYAGADVTDYSTLGGVINPTDIRLGGLRYWNSYLPKSTITLHSRGTEIYGSEHPAENAYLYQTNSPAAYVPNVKTLALNWDFTQNNNAAADGTFSVSDFSSGSMPTGYEGSNQGTIFSNLNLRHHTGKGFGFASGASVAKKEYVYSGQQRLPEQVYPEDMIKVLDADDEIFTPHTRPTKFFFAVEKSMYDSISQKMLELFASIKEFNNLIGDPIHKYRQDYKSMEKMRDIFYANVGNDPDLDKYLDYYKWLDSSMGGMIEQLFPASARVADDIRVVVESHILERSKYHHKFPTLEPRPHDPETSFRGVGCGNKYSWKFNHAPLDTSVVPVTEGTDQSVNCGWWNSRWERTHANPAVQTAIRTLDDRISNLPYPYRNKGETIPFEATAPVCLTAGIENSYAGGVNQERNKVRNVTDIVIDNIEQPVPLCGDEPTPNKQRVVTFRSTKDGKSYAGDLLSPFSLYSSSVDTGYRAYLETQGFSDIDFTNIHEDSYHNTRYEVPMQGPFTSQHVGGLLYRNTVALDPTTTGRREAHVGTFAAGTASFVSITTQEGASSPAKGQYYRDNVSKSPANIKNIRTTSTNRILGNFTKNYEVVQTQDRSINNLDLRLNTSNYDVTGSLSTVIGGLVDYEIPQRKANFVANDTVIVERFAAPGGPSVNTPHHLDLTSLQFSPNNALPFRNLIVRTPLRDALTKAHSWGGFIDGVYPEVIDDPGTAVTLPDLNEAGYSTNITSIHKTPQNGLQRIKKSGASFVTASVNDNAFINHAVPQGDRYHWFMSLSGSDVAHVEYDLLTPGTYVAGYGANRTLHDEFINNNSTYPSRENRHGIALPVSEPVGAGLVGALSVIGTDYRSADAQDGAYTKTSIGNPTEFKYKWAADYHDRVGVWSPVSQLRVSETPLGRIPRQTNEITAYKASLNADGTETITTEVYREPVVISRHRPMKHLVVAYLGTAGRDAANRFGDVALEYSYGNIKQGFAYDEANNDFNFNPNSDPRPFDVISRVSREFNEGNESAYRVAGIKEIKEFTYEEVIYPKSEYAYLPETRTRISGSSAVAYWRDNGFEMTEAVYETKRTELSARFIDEASWSVSGNLAHFVNEVSQSVTNPEYTRLVEGKATSQGTVIPKKNQVARWALAAEVTGDGSLSRWPLDSYQYSRYARRSPWDGTSTGSSSSDFSPSNVLLQVAAGYMPAGELMSLPPGYYTPTHTENPISNADLYEGSEKPSNNYAMAKYLHSTVVVPAPSSPTNYYTVGSLNLLNHVGDSQTRPTWTAGERRRKIAGSSRGELIAQRMPFYDTYEDFVNEVRVGGQSYSVIPEYRASESVPHMIASDSDSLITNTLALHGAKTGKADSSELGTAGDRTDPSFLERYATTNHFESLELVLGDATSGSPTDFMLSVDTTQKLLPYDDFYPVMRTLTLASLFSGSFGPTARYSGAQTNNYWFEMPDPTYERTEVAEGDKLAWQMTLAPYFAPGILFNSIKAGIAVDYPVRTNLMHVDHDNQFDTYQKHNYTKEGASDFNDYYVKSAPLHGVLSGSISTTGPLPLYDTSTADAARLYWSERLAFEKILEPLEEDGYSPSIKCSSIHRMTKYDMTSSLGEGVQDAYTEYKMAIGNFLGGTPEFFLESSRLSSIRSSVVDPDKIAVRKGVTYAMEIVLRRTDEFNQYSNPYAFGQPTSTGSAAWEDLTTDGALPPQMNWPLHRAEIAPFTPPYYYGDSIARITYTPKDSLFTRDQNPGLTSLSEILSDIQAVDITGSGVTYHNSGDAYYDVDPEEAVAPAYGWNRAWINKMNITASLIIDNDYSSVMGTSTPELNQWVIMPKWECPILDFPREFKDGVASHPGKYDFSSSIDDGYYGTGDAPEKTYGMWHQYGVEPASNQGVQMVVRPVPSDPAERTETYLSTSQGGKHIKYEMEFSNTSEASALVASDWVSDRFSRRYVTFAETDGTDTSSPNSNITNSYYVWYQDTSAGLGEDPLSWDVVGTSTSGFDVFTTSDTTGIAQYDYVYLTNAFGAGSHIARVTAVVTNTSVTVDLNFQISFTDDTLRIIKSDAYQPDGASNPVPYSSIGIGVDLSDHETNGEAIVATHKAIGAKFDVLGTTDLSLVSDLGSIPKKIVINGSAPTPTDILAHGSTASMRIGAGVGSLANYNAWPDSAGIQDTQTFAGVFPAGHYYVTNVGHTSTAILESTRTILSAHDSLGDLSALLGFTGSEDEGGIAKTTLGRLASEKKVHEAVIAIPFYADKSGTNYIRIPEPTNGEDGPRTKELADKFQKYSLPPALRKDLEELLKPAEQREKQPVSCYLFEFSTTFSKQDLADIWQGIMPEQSVRMQGKAGEVTVTSVDHAMPAQDFKDFADARSRVDERLRDLLDVTNPQFSGFQADIQWMVFKVKQKGISTHSDMIKKTLGDAVVGPRLALTTMTSQTQQVVGDSITSTEPELYYNWPYDYFSLIESAKIVGKVKFRPNAKEIHPNVINYDDLGGLAELGNLDAVTTADLSALASTLQGGILQRVAEAQAENVVVSVPRLSPQASTITSRLDLGSLFPGISRLPGF